MTQIGKIALLAQKVGLDVIAHRLLDAALCGRPTGKLLALLTDELQKMPRSTATTERAAIELQLLVDGIGNRKEGGAE